MSLGGAEGTCSTGLYTHSGECCKACNLGEGVAQLCGANQTVCEPCLDSEYRLAKGEGVACAEQHLPVFRLLASPLPTSVWSLEVSRIRYKGQRDAE